MIWGLQLLAVGAVSAITVSQQDFGGKLVNYKHLKVENTHYEDETVLAWTTKGDLWVSHNQGSDWSVHSTIDKVTRVFTHPYANERVLVYCSDQSVYYSGNHARSFQKLKMPATPDYLGEMFDFNKVDPNYLLLHTLDECDGFPEDCTRTAWFSRDAGSSWQRMLGDVAQCKYVNELVKDTGRDLVFCDQVDQESNKHMLTSSTDYFKSKEVHFESIVGMALDPPFLVAAAYNDQDELVSYVTLDGTIFAPANLPARIKLNHNMGYTIIDTSTRTIFLDVTTQRSYGDILKSNSNGTDFTDIISSVNRDLHGYVDFEKVSIEGVALANVVGNIDDVQNGGSKVLQSRISHSDGAAWAPVPAPQGECDNDECSLHLHGFTERYDSRNTPDSEAAVGLIISSGNTGESLLPLSEANTYMSRDAGISWSKIADEPMVWEYGDSGSIIVLVRYIDLTDTIKYSLDEGATWNEYQFSDVKVQVLNIANIPSDTSRKFLIFARGPQSRGDSTTAYSVAFDTPRPCKNADFSEWVPQHPQFGDQCIFGHELKYMRKNPEADCSVGKITFGGKELGKPLVNVANCECTREDFECDYNYELVNGECKLIQGLSSPTQAQQCANGGIYWRELTGYRRIAIDTCVGGKDLGPKQYFACPGMEEQFDKMFGHRPWGRTPNHGKGTTSFKIAFFLFFLFTAVAVLGLVMASYFEKSGRITLSDSDDQSQGATRYLALLVGAASLVFGQLREVVDRLMGTVEDRFASRRGVYSRLDDEERSRILSEHLSDDELDNPELDNFNLYEDE